MSDVMQRYFSTSDTFLPERCSPFYSNVHLMFVLCNAFMHRPLIEVVRIACRARPVSKAFQFTRLSEYAGERAFSEHYSLNSVHR